MPPQKKWKKEEGVWRVQINRMQMYAGYIRSVEHSGSADYRACQTRAGLGAETILRSGCDKRETMGRLTELNQTAPIGSSQHKNKLCCQLVVSVSVKTAAETHKHQLSGRKKSKSDFIFLNCDLFVALPQADDSTFRKLRTTANRWIFPSAFVCSVWWLSAQHSDFDLPFFYFETGEYLWLVAPVGRDSFPSAGGRRCLLSFASSYPRLSTALRFIQYLCFVSSQRMENVSNTAAFFLSFIGLIRLFFS